MKQWALKLAGAVTCSMLGASIACAQPSSGAMPPNTAPPESMSVPSQGNGAGDAIITARAKAALLSAHGVNSNNVHVTTTRGVVRLTGRVASKSEKDTAGQTVHDLDGVTAVRNDLVVDPSAK